MSKSDAIKAEAISALMDGESDEMELHRTLKTLASDTQERERWHRYQLAAAAMRRELPETMVDLSGSIRDAIEQEASPSASSRFVAPFGRFAIAASVALVAVFGVQQVRQQAPAELTAPVAAIDASVDDAVPVQLPSAFTMPQLPVRTVSAVSGAQSEPRAVLLSQDAIPSQAAKEQIEKYLNEVMIRHTENASLNTNQGMMPFARMPHQQTQ
jgi:sigma-E factor negative regulatory protein RseA